MLLFKPPQASFRHSRHPSHPHHFQAQNRRQPSSTLDPPRDSGALLVPRSRAASPWRKAYSPTIGLSGAPIHLSVAQSEMKTSSESIAHGLDAYLARHLELGPTPHHDGIQVPDPHDPSPCMAHVLGSSTHVVSTCLLHYML
jgi:hypothetical protein